MVTSSSTSHAIIYQSVIFFVNSVIHARYSDSLHLQFSMFWFYSQNSSNQFSTHAVMLYVYVVRDTFALLSSINITHSDHFLYTRAHGNWHPSRFSTSRFAIFPVQIRVLLFMCHGWKYRPSTSICLSESCTIIILLFHRGIEFGMCRVEPIQRRIGDLTFERMLLLSWSNERMSKRHEIHQFCSSIDV